MKIYWNHFRYKFPFNLYSIKITLTISGFSLHFSPSVENRFHFTLHISLHVAQTIFKSSSQATKLWNCGKSSNALCSMLCAPCFMLYVLFSLFYVPRSVLLTQLFNFIAPRPSAYISSDFSFFIEFTAGDKFSWFHCELSKFRRGINYTVFNKYDRCL